jgi:nitroimidazol reductase NimA-like FMN-containing flavoprotein (pyridoxamine 5'-phosphate oxidase superfamily)
VYHGGAIYFHGSKAGQKMRNLRANPHATFSVSKEYAIIPSYFSNPKLACPATSYFKSVLIKGYGEIVDDLQHKAEALTAFMRKLQPEGGYAPIDPADPDYAGELRAVSVVRIRIVEMTGKYKFGQNLQPARRDAVIDRLIARGRELDAETAALMRQYCPHHRRQP